MESKPTLTLEQTFAALLRIFFVFFLAVLYSVETNEYLLQK